MALFRFSPHSILYILHITFYLNYKISKRTVYKLEKCISGSTNIEIFKKQTLKQHGWYIQLNKTKGVIDNVTENQLRSNRILKLNNEAQTIHQILQTQVKLSYKGENSTNPCSNKTEILSMATQARRGIEKDFRRNQ